MYYSWVEFEISSLLIQKLTTKIQYCTAWIDNSNKQVSSIRKQCQHRLSFRRMEANFHTGLPNYDAIRAIEVLN